MKRMDCNNEDYFSNAQERRLLRAAQSGDQDARDQLVLAAMPFARKNVARLYRDISTEDLEDLIQETVPILYDCIDRYDLNHPARARLYVFAARYLQRAAAGYMRHTQIIDYCDEVPDVADELNTEKSVLTLQIESIVRAILATMSIRDQDLLFSRHGLDEKVTRAEIAARYGCPPHVIEYAEKRAQKRFEKSLKASRSLPSTV